MDPSSTAASAPATVPTIRFLWAGLHAGKVLTAPVGKGLLRGQFELARGAHASVAGLHAEISARQLLPAASRPADCSNLFPTGGTYTGVSVTPLILRWNLVSGRRFCPGFRVRVALSGPITNFRPVGPYPVPRSSGHQCFQLHPAVWVGRALFRQAAAVDLPLRQCGSHFECQHGRFQSRRERERAVFHRLYVVEMTPYERNRHRVRAQFLRGHRSQKVHAIVDAMRVEGVSLLDWSLDGDHNRSVVTIAGPPRRWWRRPFALPARQPSSSI